MGACVSTCAAWKEEAQNDLEVMGWPSQQRQQQQLALPALPAPAAPLATVSLPTGSGKQAGTADKQHQQSEQHQDQQPQHKRGPTPEAFFRDSQEQAVAHLVRHPRLQAFQQHPGGQFGLGDAYKPLKLLGRGGTGQTWLCREAASGKLYALKLQQRPIPRHAVKLAYKEITVQASTCVSSVHSTHIREALLTPTHLALVLDYEAGGSAAEFVAKQIPRVSRHDLIVDEDFARFAFKQLVLGLEHLHDNHVAHRDVKLDNTLLDGEQLPTVKLCDFQFAKYWGRPQLTRTKTHLGTAVYMSPELIENRKTHEAYDPVEVDVWAAGIWLAALLFGAFIYDNRPGADDTAAEMQILRQQLNAPWYESRHVKPYAHLLSPELRDLLTQILHQDPDCRISLEGIKAHPWMGKPLPPHLQEAWQRVRHAQLQLERRLAMLTPDHDLVQQRNSRVYDLVREAAAPLEYWQQSYQRWAQMYDGSPLVDCSSKGMVRIDMQPEAVAKRLSQRALALLDTSPPGTPKRATSPMPHVPSDLSLPALAGADSAEGHLSTDVAAAAAAGVKVARAARERPAEPRAIVLRPSPFASAAGGWH